MGVAAIPGGLIFTVILLGRPWLSARQRSHTVYVVTDRRALILYRASRIRAIDLATVGEVALHESKSGFGTITFGPFNLLVAIMPAGGPFLFPVFEFLPDARGVFEVIVKAQETARRAAASAPGWSR